MPALGGVVAAEGAEHLPTAESDLVGSVIDERVAGGSEARYQSHIIGERGQQISGSQIAGPDPLLPRQPLRGQNRRRARNEHHLADGGAFGAGVGGYDHGPLPTVIPRHGGQEAVGGGGLIFKLDAEVVPDGIAAELDNGLSRLVDRRSENRGNGFGRLDPVGGVRGFYGVDLAVHQLQSCLTRNRHSHTGRLHACGGAMRDNRHRVRTAASAPQCGAGLRPDPPRQARQARASRHGELPQR